MSIRLPEKHISYRQSQDVADICAPLFQYFNLDYFHYAKIHQDNFGIILPSNQRWHLYIQNISTEYTKQNLREGVFFLNELSPTLIPTLRNIYQSESFLQIIKKSTDAYEVYGFAAKTSLIDLYVNHPDIFKKAILYFREKSLPLRKRAYTQPLYFNNYIQQNAPQHTAQIIALNKALALKKYHVSQNGRTVSISKRELECLSLLRQGRTAKEIGKSLGLSPRTVESYIENIKNKLLISSRKQLLDWLYKTDLQSLF